MRKLKICVIGSNHDFCFFYRILWVMQELNDRGLAECIHINVSHKEYKENIEELIDGLFDWGVDVFIFQNHARSELLVEFSCLSEQLKIPKVFISEFDDDFLNVHPSNRGYFYTGLSNIKAKGKWIWKDGSIADFVEDYKEKGLKFDITRNKQNITKMLRGFIYSDALTCTTKELGEYFTGWNENVAVMPNYINPKVMPEGKKNKRDHIVIGWQGGDSHHHDLKMILPALRRIKDIYKGKVRFRFIGALFEQIYKELEAEYTEWVDPYKFYDVFADNLFDIGLIPLVDPSINKFNNGKSNIKWLEYSYYGIPSVVSGCTPYRQHIDHSVNGFLAMDEDDWVKYLRRLIDDPLFRIKMGANAKREVLAKYTIQANCYKWYDLYIKLIDKKKELYSS